MDRPTRDSLITVVICMAMLVTGAIIGFVAGAETATAEIRFELLPCS